MRIHDVSLAYPSQEIQTSLAAHFVRENFRSLEGAHMVYYRLEYVSYRASGGTHDATRA